MYHTLTTHPRWGLIEITLAESKDPKRKAKKLGPFRLAKALRTLSKQMRQTQPNDTFRFEKQDITVKVRPGKEKYFQRKYWIGRAFSQVKEWVRFSWHKVFGGFSLTVAKHPLMANLKLTPLTTKDCTIFINNRPGRQPRDQVFRDNPRAWWHSLSSAKDNNGQVFEHALARWYLNRGYKVSKTPDPNDFGVDLVLEKGNETIAVQCKDYAQSVGREDLQQFLGAMQTYGINKGIYACIGGFNKGATEFAKGLPQLELIDLDRLEKMGTQ